MATIVIPQTMKAARLKEYGKPLVAEDVPVPQPLKGEVLVKLHASPINPSDTLKLVGHYPANTVQPPMTPGMEGSGIVVAVGEGGDQKLIGKNVTFWNPKGGNWAEYNVIDAHSCYAIEDEDLDRAASSLINPLTVAAMFLEFARHGHKAVVNTAANSHLGKIFTAHFEENQIPTINIVRKKERITEMKKIFPHCVYLSLEQKDFFDELRTWSHRLNATCIFDCVAGPVAAQLLAAMPAGSTLYNYGGLGGSTITDIDPAELLFKGKVIRGFNLNWAISEDKAFLGKIPEYIKLRHKAPFPVSGQFNIDDINKALAFYAKNAGDGKVLIKPSANKH